jgi:hypothetical protein
MTERTYPREWFAVTGYYRAALETRVFDGETQHKLVWNSSMGKRYVNKVGPYQNWYPAREEAEAALAKRKEAEAFAAKQKRMSKAAPELVEALRGLLPFAEDMTESGCEAIAAARALLARIDGEEA